MKKFVFTTLLFTSFSCFVWAQPNAALYQTARNYMLSGDFDNAIKSYNDLLKQNPDYEEALMDYCYILVLQKQYDKAISLGKQLVDHGKGGIQALQTLGLAYKGKGVFKEAEQLYINGIAKFPTSGVLYNEFGECFAMQNKMPEAIIQWERGIKNDPNYSNNYYNAAMYYSKIQQDWFWVIQYGEVFLNLESFSDHTKAIKSKLYEAYSKLLSTNTFEQKAAAPDNNAFQKAWYKNIGRSVAMVQKEMNIDNLTALRTRFVLDWFANKDQENTPFHLFEHWQFLLKEGLFDAYNQWIFGEAANKNLFEVWSDAHGREILFFKEFQHSKIYKQPTGEYYK